MKKMSNDRSLLEEYDFSKGVRGKYAQRYAEGTNVVVLDPDVAEYFTDHQAVNACLRSLIPLLKQRGGKVIARHSKPREPKLPSQDTHAQA